MNTIEALDYNVQLNAFFAGDDPINTGRISFAAGKSGQTTLTPHLFCREIVFADLVSSGANYLFTLETDDAGGFTVGASEVALNLAGDPAAYFNDAGIFYLETNVYCHTIAGLFNAALPNRIDAGGMILINSYIPSTMASGAGDIILSLSFAAADINAAGQSIFRARLIFGAYYV